MGKGKENSGSIVKTFDTLVGCAQIIGTVIGAIALIVSFLGLVWAITHQETAIQVVRAISGEPTATPIVIIPPGTPLPTYTSYPTHTPYPTYTPYLVPAPEPTEALLTPTPVVVVVTATPTPVPTELPSTPLGSVLVVGDTWRQGGVSLTLDTVYLEPSYVQPVFTLQNEGNQRIIGSYTNTNIKVEDNLGTIYTVPPVTGFTWDFTLKPSESHTIKNNWIRYSGDLTNKTVEWVMITVDDISSIQTARWKINVYH